MGVFKQKVLCPRGLNTSKYKYPKIKNSTVECHSSSDIKHKCLWCIAKKKKTKVMNKMNKKY